MKTSWKVVKCGLLQNFVAKLPFRLLPVLGNEIFRLPSKCPPVMAASEGSRQDGVIG